MNTCARTICTNARPAPTGGRGRPKAYCSDLCAILEKRERQQERDSADRALHSKALRAFAHREGIDIIDGLVDGHQIIDMNRWASDNEADYLGDPADDLYANVRASKHGITNPTLKTIGSWEYIVKKVDDREVTYRKAG